MKMGQERVVVSIGVFHSVKEFEEKTRGLEHPFDTSSSITDDLKQAVFDLLTKGHKHIAMKRKATLHYYRNKMQGLEEQEKITM